MAPSGVRVLIGYRARLGIHRGNQAGYTTLPQFGLVGLLLLGDVRLGSDGRFRPPKYTHKPNGLCLRFTTARVNVRTGPYSDRGLTSGTSGPHPRPDCERSQW